VGRSRGSAQRIALPPIPLAALNILQALAADCVVSTTGSNYSMIWDQS
jgi:hypothetical protein